MKHVHIFLISSYVFADMLQNTKLVFIEISYLYSRIGIQNHRAAFLAERILQCFAMMVTVYHLSIH